MATKKKTKPKTNPSFKNFPKKLTVGIHDYSVTAHDEQIYIGGDEVYGSCHKMDKYIRVSKRYESENISAVLLHELFHAIWEEYNLEPEEKEEKVVHMLTIGLTKAMMDNPQLREYFYNQWKR